MIPTSLRLNKIPTWSNRMQILLLQAFFYMFRASCAHHQECKTLSRQPLVQVVMVAGGSSLHHIRDETSFVPNMVKWEPTYNHNYLYRWLQWQCFTLLMMGAWRPKHVTVVSSLIWWIENPPTTITTCTVGCRDSVLHSWWWAHDARNM